MADQNNIHWATDENLLGEYVLGHLPADETARLEKHLTQCEQCREAVRSEQQLAAGIRRAGRDAMKNRLAERIGKKSASSVNWYQVAGIAAAIVLLVTIGIFNKWFSSESPQAENRIRTDTLPPSAESPAVQSKTQKESHERWRVEVAKPESRERDFVSPSMAARKDARAGLDHRRLPRTEEKKSDLTVSTERNRPSALVVTGGQISAGAAGKSQEELWLAGSKIPNQNEKRAVAQNLMKDAEESQDRALKQKEMEQGFVSKGLPSGNVAPPISAVTVEQRSVIDLPFRQKPDDQKLFSIQTLIQNDTSGLRLTLFLDSLMSAGDLKHARIQAVREDSIILLIGSQRIAYKLPPGWTRQRIEELMKAK